MNEKIAKIILGSVWILPGNVYGSSLVTVVESNLASMTPSVTILNPETGNIITVTLARFLQGNPAD
jgi:hypothetical protein